MTHEYILVSLRVTYLNIRRWCAGSTHGRRHCCSSDVLKRGCGIMTDMVQSSPIIIHVEKNHTVLHTAFFLIQAAPHILYCVEFDAPHPNVNASSHRLLCSCKCALICNIIMSIFVLNFKHWMLRNRPEIVLSWMCSQSCSCVHWYKLFEGWNLLLSAQLLHLTCLVFNPYHLNEWMSLQQSD